MASRVVIDHDKASKLALEPIQQKLIAVGMMIEREVKESMVEGGGVTYTKGGIAHTASAEGEPPAVDTGRLRASISTNWTGGGGDANEDGVGDPGGGEQEFTVVVGTNVEYGPMLEFGTSRMGARPFMRPVFERYRDIIDKLISEAGGSSGVGGGQSMNLGGGI